MSLYNVLFIDDEKSVLSALVRLLRHEDYNIFTANSGEKGLEVLEKNEIAVVVCDQKMPGMDGAETLKQSRIISPDTIRITLTAYTDPDSFVKTVNEGKVSQLILKPWDDTLLKTIIIDAINQYQLVTRNKELQAIVAEQNVKLEEANRSLENRVKQRTESLEVSKTILQQNVQQIISLLSDIIGLQRDQLCGHSQRVAQISKKIAESLELPADLINKIEAAAYLHDLGFVFIPDTILRKNERDMSRDEREVWNMHAKKGAELLKTVTAFTDISQMVEEHHECYDGSGNPKGLKQWEICLGARIIAVADMYDLELHPFGNKIIATTDKACDKIHNESGRKLDPEIVKTFFENVQNEVVDLTDQVVELPFRFLKPGMQLCRSVETISGALLLKNETYITPDIIDKLKRNKNFDPVLTRFFLTRSSVFKATGQIEPSREEDKPLTEFDKYPLVLALDDELSVLNALKRELRGVYTLYTYTDPVEALEQIKKLEFKAVVCDFNMPVVKGDEFIRMVRRIYPDLPCVILTGQATKKNVERLMRAGDLSRIMTKPWAKSELLETLESVIN